MDHAVAASRCAPIENVKDAQVLTVPGKQLTAEQVRDAIVRAGALLGWRIVEVGPGRLEGTLVLPEHTAAQL